MKNVSKMINDAIKLVAKVGSMSVNVSTVPPALQTAVDATLLRLLSRLPTQQLPMLWTKWVVSRVFGNDVTV